LESSWINGPAGGDGGWKVGGSMVQQAAVAVGK